MPGWCPNAPGRPQHNLFNIQSLFGWVRCTHADLPVVSFLPEPQLASISIIPFSRMLSSFGPSPIGTKSHGQGTQLAGLAHSARCAP